MDMNETIENINRGGFVLQGWWNRVSGTWTEETEGAIVRAEATSRSWEIRFHLANGDTISIDRLVLFVASGYPRTDRIVMKGPVAAFNDPSRKTKVILTHPEASVTNALAPLQVAKASLVKLRDAGIPITFGTAAGSSPREILMAIGGVHLSAGVTASGTPIIQVNGVDLRYLVMYDYMNDSYSLE